MRHLEGGKNRNNNKKLRKKIRNFIPKYTLGDPLLMGGLGPGPPAPLKFGPARKAIQSN